MRNFTQACQLDCQSCNPRVRRVHKYCFLLRQLKRSRASWVPHLSWATFFNGRDSVMSTNSTITDEIQKFHTVSRGPLYTFSCCDQLWYRHSVVAAEKLRLSNTNGGKYLLSKTSVDDIEWICQSCDKNLENNTIPPCAAKNGMSFTEKTDFFNLNELECRLLAPRLAFQKLMQAPRRNQLKIKRNVNVPADVNNTVNILPRLPQESGTIKVQLKRRLQYQSSQLSLNVRPYKNFTSSKLAG